MPSVISPQVDSRSCSDGGRTQITSSGSAPLRVVLGDVDVAEVVVNGEDLAGEEDQARQPRLPNDPHRPAKREIAEYCVSHWPFRTWCRHCVCGRVVSKPHGSRSDEDHEFGRERIPTDSLDHCFLGSADDDDDKKAHGSPFLVLYDCETEAVYAIAAADKACKPWILEYACNLLKELGYSGIKVALKSDAAPALRGLKKLVAAKRSCATVPMGFPPESRRLMELSSVRRGLGRGSFGR